MKNKEKAEISLKEGKAESCIVIVADSDMLNDLYYMKKQNFFQEGFWPKHKTYVSCLSIR